MESAFTLAAWIVVMILSLAMFGYVKEKNLKIGVTFVFGGVTLLVSYVVIDYVAWFLFHREFNLLDALLLIDTRYGSGVIIIDYAIIVSGLLILIRNVSSK